VWLSLFCFIALAPPIVLLYFAVRGMNRVNRQAPLLLQKAQQLQRNAADKVVTASDHVVAPVIRIQRGSTRLRRSLNAFFPAKARSNRKYTNMGEQ
jgi:hypothetical protein